MKKTILRIVLLILISTNLIFSQKTEHRISESELIGFWRFVEMKDTLGKRIDTIYTKPTSQMKKMELSGVEIVNRVDIRIIDEINYENPVQERFRNIKKVDDKGVWELTDDQNKITFYMEVNKSQPHFKFLKQRNLLEKRSNGKYYQLVTDYFIKRFSTEELVLIEEENKLLVYRKE